MRSDNRSDGVWLFVFIAVAMLLGGTRWHWRSQAGGFTPAADRRTLPDVALPQLGGGEWRLADHRGQVVLINYWATWCQPCREELPGLMQVARDSGAAWASRWSASRWMKARMLPLAFSNSCSSSACPTPSPFRLRRPATARVDVVIPTTVLLDRQGRIVKTYIGAVEPRGLCQGCRCSPRRTKLIQVCAKIGTEPDVVSIISVLELTTPVKFVKRIGERIAAALATRGVETVEDLLYHLPFRYEDRLNPQPIASLTPGAMASIIGEVRGSVLLRTRAGPMFEMTLGQGLGTVKCIWFHGTYLKDRFKAGQMVAVYGKLEPSRSAMAAAAIAGQGGSAGRFKMIQPQFEIIPDGDRSGRFPRNGPHRPRLRVARRHHLRGAPNSRSKWMRRVVWSIFEELCATTTRVPHVRRSRP